MNRGQRNNEIIEGGDMKHIQVITEKQYIKAWLKLLTEAVEKPRQINTNLFGTADEKNMNEYKILNLTFMEQ